MTDTLTISIYALWIHNARHVSTVHDLAGCRWESTERDKMPRFVDLFCVQGVHCVLWADADKG